MWPFEGKVALFREHLFKKKASRWKKYSNSFDKGSSVV